MFLISPLGLKLYMRAKELIIFTYIFDKPLYKPKREKKIQYYNRNYYRQQKKKSILSLQNCLQFILKEKSIVIPQIRNRVKNC